MDVRSPRWGSFSQVQGEFRQTKNSLSEMINMLSCFQEEVLRVVCDVGIEGQLGGQAQAGLGLQGIWKDLTDNVNTMATNLTLQVRAVAQVTTAVANGDLSKKMTAEAKGEFLELKNTINTMVDQLNAFASEVTRVAREVGTEGKLGGQAQVAGTFSPPSSSSSAVKPILVQMFSFVTVGLRCSGSVDP